MTDERLAELESAFPELVGEVRRLRELIRTERPDLAAHLEPTPIRDGDFSVRVMNRLRKIFLYSEAITFEELAATSSSQLRALVGFGQMALWEVREKLADRGLKLKDDASLPPIRAR
jgi:DNA-directed RNA polymerase alpha subunit